MTHSQVRKANHLVYSQFPYYNCPRLNNYKIMSSSVGILAEFVVIFSDQQRDL